MDRISTGKRSWNMSRIRSKNTLPERRVRSVLHNLGYRFRLNKKQLPGTPDIVLSKYNVAIFVHGCFWHRHQNCKFAYSPQSRKQFWTRKFSANIHRHEIVTRELTDLGWNVLVIWECELSSVNSLKQTLISFIIGANKLNYA